MTCTCCPFDCMLQTEAVLSDPRQSDRELNPKAAVQPLQCKSVKSGCTKCGWHLPLLCTVHAMSAPAQSNAHAVVLSTTRNSACTPRAAVEWARGQWESNPGPHAVSHKLCHEANIAAAQPGMEHQRTASVQFCHFAMLSDPKQSDRELNPKAAIQSLQCESVKSGHTKCGSQAVHENLLIPCHCFVNANAAPDWFEVASMPILPPVRWALQSAIVICY